MVRALAKSRGESRSWQLFVVIFPLCLTAIAGFFVDRRLAQLAAELKAAEQRRDVLLHLAQTSYAETLKVYVQIDQKILSLENRMHEGRAFAQTGSPSRNQRQVNDAIIQLRELYEGSRLYLTPELLKSLTNVIGTANEAARSGRIEQAQLDGFLTVAQAAREQMTKDLRPEAFSASPFFSSATGS
jgi:hypothetical protein